MATSRFNQFILVVYCQQKNKVCSVKKNRFFENFALMSD